MIKRLLSMFVFLPFVKRMLERKYYATGLGTYLVNSFFKRILRIGAKGDYLLHFTSRVNSPKNLKIVDGSESSSVYLSLSTSGGCYYQAINGIEIGPGTLWSYGCQFISANHTKGNYEKHQYTQPIRIGSNVWMGSHVIILPGITIGDNAIIGAGSVVTKDVPSGEIHAGNPARKL